MSNKEYPVGYGKPPKEHQFKKGQSGNPNGRPKGSKNLDTVFMNALWDPVSVTEGNRTRSMSTAEALVKRLLHKAMNGHLPSLRLVFQEKARISPPQQKSAEEIAWEIHACTRAIDEMMGGGQGYDASKWISKDDDIDEPSRTH